MREIILSVQNLDQNNVIKIWSNKTSKAKLYTDSEVDNIIFFLFYSQMSWLSPPLYFDEMSPSSFNQNTEKIHYEISDQFPDGNVEFIKMRY